MGYEAASEYEKTHVDEPYVGGMIAYKLERGRYPRRALNGEEDSDHRHEEPRINQCGCTYADASKSQKEQEEGHAEVGVTAQFEAGPVAQPLIPAKACEKGTS